jgi:hypothetical protein
MAWLKWLDDILDVFLRGCPYFLVADVLQAPKPSSFPAEKLDTPRPKQSVAEILASARKDHEPSNTAAAWSVSPCDAKADVQAAHDRIRRHVGMEFDDYRGPVVAMLIRAKGPPVSVDAKVHHFPNRVKITFESPRAIKSGEMLCLSFAKPERR